MIRTLSASLVLCALTAQVSLRADEQSQPQPPKAYVQIGPLLIVQPPGIANHRVHPALSGHTPGVTTSVGAFVTSTLAIEGEFAALRFNVGRAR